MECVRVPLTLCGRVGRGTVRGHLLSMHEAARKSRPMCVLVLGLQKQGHPDCQLAGGWDVPVTYPADLWILREGEAVEPLGTTGL